MTSYLYNSINGSEPPAIDLKNYAGIYLKANDLKFAELRDKYFKASVYWGAWWKFDPSRNQAEEAYSFSNLINGNAGTLPPAIQVILPDQPDWNNVMVQLHSFFTEFIRWYKKVPLFETNLTTWNAMYKFTIPTIVLGAPLWLWGTPPAGFIHPVSLISHDDTTIQFEGTKAELLTWAQTYQIPINSVDPPLTNDELLHALDVVKRWWKQ